MINQSPQQSIYKLLQGSTVTTIIDVGANVGQFGLDMRRAGFDGQIISYEPGQESFGLLGKTARNSEPWKISQIALGSAEAEKLINVSGNSGLSSSFLEMETDHLKHFPASITVKQEIAHVSTLDKQISDLGLDPKSILLKLDVQGYEEHILATLPAVAHRISIIQLETSLSKIYEGGSHLSSTAALLDMLNYTVVSVMTERFQKKTLRALDTDLIAVRNDLLPE
jgi:FkbM family methyltransferase